jgi:hypothetical protein
MKNVFKTALAATALIAAGGVMAGDRPGADWVSIEQALQTAKSAGYTQVYGIKADDDYWEGKGTKADGEKHKFRIDGRTGEMSKDERD